jgi:hypothetical protein
VRLSFPFRSVLQANVLLGAICGAISCTPQPLVIERPCPPVEYPVTQAPVATASASETSGPRTLDIRITPVRSDSGTNVVAVEVTMRFSSPPVDFGNATPIELHLDPHVAGAATGDRIDDLEARDSEGSLALRRVTAADPTKAVRAEWKAERRAHGPVTVSYRMQLLAEDAARDEILGTDGGILALGRALFLQPATTEDYTIRVSWDTQPLGPEAQTSSSFGADVTEIQGPPNVLENGIWMAGPLDEITIRSPKTNGREKGRFRMVSLGKGAFDLTEVGAWSQRAWLSARPIATTAPGFDVFVWPTGKPGARFDLYVFGQGAIAKTGNDVKFAWPEKLALTEAFVKSARGSKLLQERWFDEGFGTYLALDGLRKTGLAAPNDIAGEITKRSERYFASPYLRQNSKQLAAQKDPLALTHIEDRGFLLAAELEGKIRVRSAGARTFVDFLRIVEPKAVLVTDTADLPSPGKMTGTVFDDALEKELGAEAVKRYRAIVESGTALADVADDAFGPCFKKAKKKISREDAETKKRESVDGFAFATVAKLPASCGNLPVKARPAGQ